MRSAVGKRRSAILLALLLAGAPLAQAAEPALLGLPDVRAVVAQRGKAVVKVETFELYVTGLVRRTLRLLNPFPLRSNVKDAASFVFFVPTGVFYSLRRHVGSGVLIDREGHLLTNDHVVRGADRITIRLLDADGVKRKLKGRLLGRDPHTDVALVKIDPKGVPLVAAPLGDSDALEPGDWIIAIGHPYNLTGTVTVGVLSGRHRQLRSNLIEDYLQVEAAVNPGNSGGPILNTRGEVVGIVALGMFPANNIGFAVPASLIAPCLDDLRAGRRPRRGYLGITVSDITPELAEDKRLDVHAGVLITRVRYFSPAGDAELESGDVLVSIDGKEMKEARDVQRAILRTAPGSTVTITVRRHGKLLTLRPTVGTRRSPFRIF